MFESFHAIIQTENDQFSMKSFHKLTELILIPMLEVPNHIRSFSQFSQS